MTDRTDWTFLGRVIGSASGWDGEMNSFVLYDFQPQPNINLPPCDLTIEIETGLFKSYNDDGTESWAKDIIDTLRVTS